MMKTSGTCAACGGKFSKAAMRQHLGSCSKRPANAETSLHILVEGNPPSVFWMHLAAQPSAKLVDLDRFLRAIWLECCGHLSAFKIADVSYSSGGDMPGRKMSVPLRNVLRPGLRFGYEYDFGSTTALKLQVVGTCAGTTGDGPPIRLRARNSPPPLACDCGKPATQLCTECGGAGRGWLCAGCAAEHACGEELLLPVVNSPRVGVCGYTG
jgi:hypothetical protein